MTKIRDLHEALGILVNYSRGVTITKDELISFGGPNKHSPDGYRLTDLGWTLDPFYVDYNHWVWWDYGG